VELSYWRLAGGAKVDFIIGDLRLAIEAKATARVTEDGIRIVPAERFALLLAGGEIF